MLESADACGVGLAAMSGDVVESTNFIFEGGIQWAYFQGWGCG